MRDEQNYFLCHSLATSTLSTYRSGFNSYKKFCSHFNKALFPLCSSTLELFVTYLARRLAFSSIKVYLCSIQYLSIINGFSERINSMHKLYYVLRGVRLFLGSSRNRPRRLPLTIVQIRHIYRYTKLHLSRHDSAMFQAAISLAFFAMLRSSEFCSPGSHHTSSATLLLSDISIQRDIMLVRIKQSKTDPFKEGCVVRVTAVKSSICPIRAMTRYLSLRRASNGPLFQFCNLTYLTRSGLSTLLSTVLPGININTHSLRIGGASAAASNGLSDATIQVLGRWSSDAYRRYLHYSDDAVCSMMARMATDPETTII